MVPNNYNLLSLEEKAELISREGEPIMIVATSDFKISLYAFNGDYVEMFYSLAFDRLEQIRVVPNERLDFYLQNIEIDFFN
jgi:hypothetical protein